MYTATTMTTTTPPPINTDNNNGRYCIVEIPEIKIQHLYIYS